MYTGIKPSLFLLLFAFFVYTVDLEIFGNQNFILELLYSQQFAPAVRIFHTIP